MSENKTHAEIVAEMKTERPGLQNATLNANNRHYAGLLEAARDDELDRHRREVDALKRRRSELDAEVAAKDEVIKRLNDAIAEEQRRDMATTKKSLVVGNAAKLREFAELVLHMNDDGYWNGSACICDLVGKATVALAAPPRNCDKYENDNAIEQFERKILGKEAATTYERLLNMRENWFRYNRWLFEKAKESEATDGE